MHNGIYGIVTAGFTANSDLKASVLPGLLLEISASGFLGRTAVGAEYYKKVIDWRGGERWACITTWYRGLCFAASLWCRLRTELQHWVWIVFSPLCDFVRMETGVGKHHFQLTGPNCLQREKIKRMKTLVVIIKISYYLAVKVHPFGVNVSRSSREAGPVSQMRISYTARQLAFSPG